MLVYSPCIPRHCHAEPALGGEGNINRLTQFFVHMERGVYPQSDRKQKEGHATPLRELSPFLPVTHASRILHEPPDPRDSVSLSNTIFRRT